MTALLPLSECFYWFVDGVSTSLKCCLIWLWVLFQFVLYADQNRHRRGSIWKWYFIFNTVFRETKCSISVDLCPTRSCNEVWLVIFVLSSQQCVNVLPSQKKCVRTPRLLFHLPLPLLYLPLVLSSVLCGKSAKSRTLAGINKAGGYQTGSSGPSISDSEGKMTFPWLFILGRHQEECRSSCSIPAGRSDPVNSRLPLQQLSLRSGKGSGCIQTLWCVDESSSLKFSGQ